ncbi:MAG TPA: hypothetical protein H9803_03330 [Candidatus Ligilactobacillus excrementavium]|nr:hypothetical protein [Candidatus Ligilactobacillus excrementavium]
MKNTFEDELRTILLQEYGFEKAIARTEISDKDLLLIKSAIDDTQLKERITNIQTKRKNDELKHALENYPSVKHPDSAGTAILKKNYADTLLTALPDVNKDQQILIKEVLEM